MGKVKQRLLAFIVAASVVTCSAGPEKPKPPSVKKFIEWGGDEPDPAFMRKNARQMDRVGFDGLVFHAQPVVGGESVNFAWQAWSPRRFTFEDFSENIADLRACGFRRLTDNFLRFNVCPGNVDWFDDAEFGAVTNNAGVAARVAREGGAKGLMFDVEMYQEQLFTYAKQARKRCKSFAEYEVIVRQRGLEFARALSAEFPDITILMPYAYELTAGGSDRSAMEYGLFKAFLDGLFEAADTRMKIVHAFERSYAFRYYKQYAEAYEFVRDKLAAQSAVPERYRERVQVGFGIWLDNNHRRYGWNLDDFQRNYFTPEEFVHAAISAASVSDRYVWIYSERPRWWGEPVRMPKAYAAALQKAKKGAPRTSDSRFPERAIRGDLVRASAQLGYDDGATFGPLKSDWVFRADLPKAWKFRTDPRSAGEGARWFASDKAVPGLREIEIGRFWDEQIEPYQGVAWYFLSWQAPDLKLSEGAQLALLFGAVDETAKVWVNGTLVGTHDEGSIGWNRPFVVDVTRSLVLGKRNVIAVKVENRERVGGIWKGIKLASRRTSADVEPTPKPPVVVDRCPS